MTNDLTAALTDLHHEAVRATCRLITHNIRCTAERYTLGMGSQALDNPADAHALETACTALDAALEVVAAAERDLTKPATEAR